MIRALALSTLLTGLLAGCSAPPAAEPPQANAPVDLQSIETLRTAFTSAYTTGNADALGALYTDDAVSQTNMQATAVGRAAIVEQLKGTFAQFNTRMDVMPEETHTLGDQGWERGRFIVTLTPRTAGATPTTAEGRYMILLERTANGWRISRDMDNVAVPPQPLAPNP